MLLTCSSCKRPYPVEGRGWGNRKHCNRCKSVMTAIRWEKKRAERLGLTEHLTATEWLELCDRTGNRCLGCNQPASDRVKLTIDHITPMSKGGSNTVENIQPLCIKCNTRKKNKIAVALGVKVDDLYTVEQVGN